MKRTRVVVAGWLLPFGWTTLWGLFRGLAAHGAYTWWAFAHYIGWLLSAIAATWLHLRFTKERKLKSMLLLAVAMVLTTWLAFQTGLALHEPPRSLADFFLNEP